MDLDLQHNRHQTMLWKAAAGAAASGRRVWTAAGAKTRGALRLLLFNTVLTRTSTSTDGDIWTDREVVEADAHMQIRIQTRGVRSAYRRGCICVHDMH